MKFKERKKEACGLETNVIGIIVLLKVLIEIKKGGMVGEKKWLCLKR